jgi:hypothetical protein
VTDITMCPGSGCQQRNTCVRYLATPDPIKQSWAHFDLAMQRDGECEHYWPRVPLESPPMNSKKD